MRDEARERFSDLAWSEAMNDNAVDDILALEVERDHYDDANGTTWEPVVLSNALRYLLYDELRIGTGIDDVLLHIKLVPREQRTERVEEPAEL